MGKALGKAVLLGTQLWANSFNQFLLLWTIHPLSHSLSSLERKDEGRDHVKDLTKVQTDNTSPLVHCCRHSTDKGHLVLQAELAFGEAVQMVESHPHSPCVLA